MNTSIFNDPIRLSNAERWVIRLKNSKLGSKFHGDECLLLLTIDLAMQMNIPVMVALTNMLWYDDGGSDWRGSFKLAALNASDRFDKPVAFEYTGSYEEGNRACQAIGVRMGIEVRSNVIRYKDIDGQVIENSEPWIKDPDLMLKYRAASEFATHHIGDMLKGLAPIPGVNRRITAELERAAAVTAAPAAAEYQPQIPASPLASAPPVKPAEMVALGRNLSASLVQATEPSKQTESTPGVAPMANHQTNQTPPAVEGTQTGANEGKHKGGKKSAKVTSIADRKAQAAGEPSGATSAIPGTISDAAKPKTEADTDTGQAAQTADAKPDGASVRLNGNSKDQLMIKAMIPPPSTPPRNAF